MTSEELREVMEVCRKFAAKELGPRVLEADLNSDVEWAKAVWTKSREIGLPGFLIPEELGGVGQSGLGCALVLDIFSSECAGVASVFANHFVGCLSILSGTKTQKERYFSLLANVDQGESAIATVIFPTDGDGRELSLREERGRLLLSGKSSLIGNAELAKFFCVFLDEGEKGENISCLVVDRDTPGVSRGEGAMLPGLKVNPFASIGFEDVEVDQATIIGERRKARKAMESAQELFYGLVAAMAMGSARSAYRRARSYAEERYQYGKNIIYHQEIQRMLGNMRMKLSLGTAGYLRAFQSEQVDLPYSSPEARFAKIFCTDAALEIAIDAIQIHGGYGYMHDYGVEKIMRDVKVLHLLGGSTPAMHVQTIAREL